MGSARPQWSQGQGPDKGRAEARKFYMYVRTIPYPNPTATRTLESSPEGEAERVEIGKTVCLTHHSLNDLMRLFKWLG